MCKSVKMYCLIMFKTGFKHLQTDKNSYVSGLWIASDDYSPAGVCGEVVYNQLKELSTVVHPVTNKVLSVHRRSHADRW